MQKLEKLHLLPEEVRSREVNSRCNSFSGIRQEIGTPADAEDTQRVKISAFSAPALTSALIMSLQNRLPGAALGEMFFAFDHIPQNSEFAISMLRVPTGISSSPHAALR